MKKLAREIASGTVGSKFRPREGDFEACLIQNDGSSNDPQKTGRDIAKERKDFLRAICMRVYREYYVIAFESKNILPGKILSLPVTFSKYRHAYSRLYTTNFQAVLFLIEQISFLSFLQTRLFVRGKAAYLFIQFIRIVIIFLYILDPYNGNVVSCTITVALFIINGLNRYRLNRKR